MTNLAQRVLVGVVAIPIIYLLCMAGGLYFFAFAAIASGLALHEFYGLARAKGARPLTWLGIAAGFFVNLSFLRVTLQTPPLAVVLTVSALAMALCELFRDEGSAIVNLSTTVFGVLYVSLFFGTLIGIRDLDTATAALPAPYSGGAMVMAMLVTIWICDSAAFHIGKPFGAHKLYPRVSPQKSWEGAVAGLAGAVITAVVAKYIALPFLPLPGAVYLGIIVGTVGQMGDLVESLLKRDAGVKDSSTLIPGHGGVFDRFDSVLLVAPCLFLYLDCILF
ncbi:MAG TPA: phosphatidate cytidylyltransferase [Vicinamibacterales bacterium]|nr:phosphatidate cytidylyltransferase [Vicinamibacterales bacterium]